MVEGIPVPIADPATMAWHELNDLGNAERVIALAGGKLLWVDDDFWIAFDGQRWSVEAGARLAQRLAHDMARHIPIEAETLAAQVEAGKDSRGNPLTTETQAMLTDRVAALYKHAIGSGNANKTTAALAQAKSSLAATRDDFDREGLALNCPEQTLRFVRGEDGWAVRVSPHDPADRIGRVTTAAYDPAATCPQWIEHMQTVLPDPAVRRYFQAIMGYALTGEVSEQCICILQGKGGDGKSTTIDVIREVLGLYGKTASVESFLHGAMRSGAEASPDMARLAGDTRIVCTSEPKIGAMLDEGRIKQITGGQPVTARELHGTPFEYRPRFLLVLECNRKPRISGDDDGIWRRVIVIPFPHQFKGAAADKGVTRRLLGEASGVLNWLIEGTLIWLREGLIPPAKVQEAIDDYRKSSNPFGEWFTTFVDTSDEAARTLSADLFASYKQFCEDGGVEDRNIMTSTAFGRALGDKQLVKAKGADGKVIRKGCRLRAAGEMDLAPAVETDAGGSGPPAGQWDDADPGPGWEPGD